MFVNVVSHCGYLIVLLSLICSSCFERKELQCVYSKICVNVYHPETDTMYACDPQTTNISLFFDNTPTHIYI